MNINHTYDKNNRKLPKRVDKSGNVYFFKFDSIRIIRNPALMKTVSMSSCECTTVDTFC